MEYIVDPAVYWKEVAKLRWWHPCTWLQNITSVPMNNALIGLVSIDMLLLDVRSPRRWAWPGVISARVYWRYLNYSVCCLCLSRGLEWVIRVYARRQGTTFWFILYQTMYVPLFNYNILTDIPIPVDIVPSPNPNIPLSSAVLPSSSLSTVYTTISPNHILPPHLCSYTPSRSKTKS